MVIIMRNHFYELVICGHMVYRITAVLIHIKTRYKMIKVIPPDDEHVDGRNVSSLCYAFI